MFKFVFAVLLVGVLSVSSAFAGHCHNNVQQIVVAQPVAHFVQPVRQTVVEVVDNHHFNNVQRVVVRQPVKQQVVVQRVVNNNHHNAQAVRVEKVVVRDNNRGFFQRNNGRNVQKSVIINR